MERPRSEITTADGKKGCLDDEIRFIPSGKQQLQKTKEPNINTIKTKRLNINEEVEEKQTEQSYVQDDKASQKTRSNGKKTQVTNSQVSRDSTKSVNRKSSAWQNRFSVLSGDDELCDSETLENQAQSCSTKTSNVQVPKDKNTVKENQRNKEWKKNKKNILIIGDSMVKHLDGRKLKGSLRNGQNV